MRKELATGIKRKLAWVSVIAILATTIYNSSYTAQAAAKKFYLDGIKVSSIEDAELSGSTIFVDGKDFELDENGNIIVEDGDTRVKTDGGTNRPYLETEASALSVAIGTEGAYFDDSVSTDGTDDTTVDLSFLKKYVLNYGAKLQTSENASTTIAADDVTMSVVASGTEKMVEVDSDTYNVSKGSYDFTAVWKGITYTKNIVVSSASAATLNINAEFRGYVVYGEGKDFYLTKDGTTLDSLEAVNSANKLVVPANSNPTPQKPFDGCIVEKQNADNSWSAYETVEAGKSIDLLDGTYRVGMTIGNDTIAYSDVFKVDGALPELKSKKWKAGDEAWEDLERSNTPNVELKDQEKISLQFIVEDSNLSETEGSVVLCTKSGDTETALGHNASYAQGSEDNQHIYTFEIMEEVDYSDLYLRVTDSANNVASFRLFADVIVDGAPPTVNKVEIKANDMDFVEWVKGSNVVVRDNFEVKVVVSDTCPAQTAVMKYKQGSSTTEEAVSSDGFDVDGKAYKFTFDEQQSFGSYNNVTFHVEDETGNKTDVSWGNIIQDTVEPEFNSIKWKAAKETEYKNLTQNVLVVDKEGVNFQVTVEDEHLSEIYICKEDGTVVGESVKFAEGAEPVAVFTINSDDYNYTDLMFMAKDAAGNEVSSGDLFKVIVDTQNPEFGNDLSSGDLSNGWYSKAANDNKNLQYTFTIKDHAALKSVKLVPQSVSGGDISWSMDGEDLMPSASGECSQLTTVNGAVIDTNGRIANSGLRVYKITTAANRFSNAKDQNEKYNLVIVDEFGQETVIENALELKVDNTNPEKKAYVNYDGANKWFYKKDSNVISNPGNQYELGDTDREGTLYSKDTIKLNIFVRDLIAANAINGAFSDIAKVDVKYLVTTESVHASYTDDVTVSYPNGEAKIESTKLTLSKEQDMQKIELPIEVKDGQKIVGVFSVKVTDAAGNTVTIGSNSIEEVAVDKVQYVVDNKAPVITAKFPGEPVGNVYYYNKANTTVETLLTENNFFAVDVVDTATFDGSDALSAKEKFALQQGTEEKYVYRSRYTFEGLKDGAYQIGFKYSDRSTNAMVAGENLIGSVTDGKYSSPKMVLDTTPPKLTITYKRGGKDITGGIRNGNCYSGDVQVTITIEDANFTPDDDNFKLDFSAYAAEDNSTLSHKYDAGNWSNSGNTYTYIFDCTEEGTYRITASCKDNAGNESASVKPSNFSIDKTNPEVTISYDITRDNGYYNTDRVATVTVKERNFNVDAANFIVGTSGPDPRIYDWEHSGANGCSGGNHVNGCKWRADVRFSEDGDYTFTFKCTDKAGRESSTPASQAFTIDKTRPEISVSYNNNNVSNSRYYNAARTATITIHEHNFDADGVELRRTTTDGVLNPVSAWRSVGHDTYAATINYNADGAYTFDVDYIDKAGNEAADYAGDNFVVDTIAPTLAINKVVDHSANNGAVTPEVVFEDKNFDRNNVKVRVTGVNNGEVQLESEATYSSTGRTIQYMDFPHTVEQDDLYTLNASVTDLAGNTTEDSILFSVNRFGSVYTFSEETSEMLEHFYVNHGPKLTITEINVDTLEFQEITYSRDGEIVTLVKDEDYTVVEEGADHQWKQYTYEIYGDNFEQEGVYVVTLQSLDRATNDSSNRLKEKNVEFTVDKTVPSVVVAGVENNQTYNAVKWNVTVDAMDNIYLTEVDVYLDGEVLQHFDEVELAENKGIVGCEILESNDYQTLYVIAKDAAGNVLTTDSISFLLTSNFFIRLINNKPLLWGIIAGIVLILGGLNFFLFFGKKRKKDTERS